MSIDVQVRTIIDDDEYLIIRTINPFKTRPYWDMCTTKKIIYVYNTIDEITVDKFINEARDSYHK
jgi:hypothetical protein